MTGFPSALLAELQQTRLITNETGFFNSLRPLGEDCWSQLGLNRSLIEETAGQFAFGANVGGVVNIDLHFFQTDHAPQPNVALYGRFLTDGGELVAVWASTVFMDEKGKRGSEIVVVEKDMSRADLRGFGRAFITFYNQFNRTLQLDYEFIRAAWLGRKVWTQLGNFQYDTRYTFLVDGEPMSQSGLAIRNFGRFLKHHDIQPDMFVYMSDDGELVPFSTAAANTVISKPADFLRIVDKNSAKLVVTPLIDYQVVGDPTSYNIGEAFMLADNRPSPGQTIEIRFVKDGTILSDGDVWPPNNRFSDRAMPSWVGIRNFT